MQYLWYVVCCCKNNYDAAQIDDSHVTTLACSHCSSAVHYGMCKYAKQSGQFS